MYMHVVHTAKIFWSGNAHRYKNVVRDFLPYCKPFIVCPHVFCPLSSSLSRDLLTKKDPEFRSIFQHIQSAQLRQSPSELFAQHVVSIVHYIKGRVRPAPLSPALCIQDETTGVHVAQWTLEYFIWWVWCC